MSCIAHALLFTFLCSATGLQMNRVQHELKASGDDRSVTIAVQYFKHPQNIEPILNAFSKSSVVKEVVFGDDSHDVDWSLHEKEGKYPFAVRHLDQPNLHEIRNYNAISKVATGDYVVFWQDDNIPSEDTSYLEDAVGAFKAYPDLGFIALDPAMKKYPPRFETAELVEKGTSGCKWTCKDWNMPEHDFPADAPVGLTMREPLSGRKMVFTQFTSLFAYITPKETFRQLGQFDEKYSNPGEPGIGFEEAAGLKTWANGKMFAVMDIRDKQDKENIGVGGHSSKDKSNPNSSIRMKNEKINNELMGKEFGARIPKIGESIFAANTCMLKSGSESASLQACLAQVPKVPAA